MFRQRVATDPIEPNGTLNSWLLRNSSAFPDIWMLLKIVHCVPATSVMSERVFSKVGLILANKLRNRFVFKFCTFNLVVLDLPRRQLESCFWLH